MRNATMIAVTLSMAAALVLALPLAGALAFGSDAAGAKDLATSGAHVAYGQTWVGAWMRTSGWNGFESDLRTISAQGATPVVMWYYWGDPISVTCVQYGCNGNSKSNWDAMAAEMATRAKAILGTKPFLVVLEPEFNKNGISSWETFDGYLADQSRAIKAIAPSAKTVVGFGSWGGYDIFDRAVAASDYTGFQVMRASTRHTAAEATGAADSMISTATTLHDLFHKPILVFDLAIGTYGGWEGVQKTALENIGAKETQLANAGVFAIVWRYVFDNNYSSGYFGPAESTWGVKYASGVAKPAYATLMSLVKGGLVATTNTTPTTTTASVAPPTSAPAAGATFSGVSGNEWWIQATVSGAPTSVTASVNGGTPISMTKQSWGAYAVSTHAAPGSIVTLRAAYSGTSATASYNWPSATLTTAASAPSSTTTTTLTTSSSTFTASFSGMTTGNAWWVQTSVAGSQTIARVDVSLNGGPWTALDHQSWGGWAKSLYTPAGTHVQFRATSTTGATATSTTYSW